jgi:hypothetical protein
VLERIVSGGQTGADQAAWRAVRAGGLATGGWMPKGFLTEDGPRPEFADLYGAREMPTDSYRLRTEQNVRDSHGTLWFGSLGTAGAEATLIACKGMGRPRMVVVPRRQIRPSDVVALPRLALIGLILRWLVPGHKSEGQVDGFVDIDFVASDISDTHRVSRARELVKEVLVPNVSLHV